MCIYRQEFIDTTMSAKIRQLDKSIVTAEHKKEAIKYIDQLAKFKAIGTEVQGIPAFREFLHDVLHAKIGKPLGSGVQIDRNFKLIRGYYNAS